jgi:TRAP-type C4-dicarboxylate transport system permease small subunit
MRAVARLIDFANMAMEWLCKVIAVISMGLIFAVLAINVTARYLRIEALQLGNEIPELLFPWLVASSVGLAAIHGAHISIHILRDRLSREGVRLMGTVMSLVAIVLYALTLKIVIDLLPIVMDDRSPILGLSLGWTYAAMGISFVTILLHQMATLMALWGWSSRAPGEHIDSTQAAG